MQCNCGGYTTDQQTVRQGKPLAKWQGCRSCGRVYIQWLRPFEPDPPHHYMFNAHTGHYVAPGGAL